MPSSTAVRPISDSLIDQLQDEMREMARGLRGECSQFIEDDDVTLNKNLAWSLDDIASDRGLLVRFALLLRGHSNRASAIAELCRSA